MKLLFIILILALVIAGLFFTFIYTPQFDGFQLKGFSDNIHNICYPLR